MSSEEETIKKDENCEGDKSKSSLTAYDERRHRIVHLMKRSASKLMEDIDPWKHHNIHLIPAERVIRHLYHPTTQNWATDETIVKMEPEPFTHGAMRYCYRMKKRSTPPIHSTNHNFHKMGWAYASNYVAKAYINKDGIVDTSETAKQNICNDIVLQYEAQYWADQFNQRNPPKKIHFLRAYAIEFPNRIGQPWFAVERYITGTDPYGKSFIKHNTNAGFVDPELRRVTPQIFSAYTFYASLGHRLVADIQGIGDLYTDPQVLSSDYRFGDGDLGPRGMAFFFTHFRNCSSSDALGIPIFPLSKNEMRYHQLKYDDDEITMSDDDTDHVNDEESLSDIGDDLNRFQKLDLNRQRRSSILLSPPDALLPLSRRDTVRRSNVTTAFPLHDSLPSLSLKAHLHRTKSDMDDIHICLERAKYDHFFTHIDFHRHKSGELKERHFKTAPSSDDIVGEEETNLADTLGTKSPSMRSTIVVHKSAIVRNGGVAPPVPITDETRMNLGRVHYQLAVLHGLGRFPEIVAHPTSNNSNIGELPNHDVFTVLFHLSHGASLQNVASCLALGRVQAGLTSQVSDLLPSIVSVDFDSAKVLYRRAMASPFCPPSQPKVAAGCFLYQILKDENALTESDNNDTKQYRSKLEMVQVLEETLKFMDDMYQEELKAQKHQKKIKERQSFSEIAVGDHVEANYALDGTYYPAVVKKVLNNDDVKWYHVMYDDDDSYETVSHDNVRVMIPPTATQTTLGGPLTDKEAFKVSGLENLVDDNPMFKNYELYADLALLMEQVSDINLAVNYYEIASEKAMAAGKMKMASECSCHAMELKSNR
jgi:elongation factor 2 kinase